MIFIMLAVRRENLTSVQIFQRPFAKRGSIWLFAAL